MLTRVRTTDQASQSGRKRRGRGIAGVLGRESFVPIFVYSVLFLSRLENGEASGYAVVKWRGVGFTALREEEVCSCNGSKTGRAMAII